MAILSYAQAIQYAKQAGFSGDALVTIVAIAKAESNLNTAVVNSIGATGILQIYLAEHPDVTSAQAKDPAFSFQYAWRLSSSGKNFCPWQSYDPSVCGRDWDNRYAQFIPAVRAAVNASGGGSSVTYKQGTTNTTYVKGQCTDWASFRYHQLTGIWVGNYWGDAHMWAASAMRDGWKVGNTAPTGIPSIICLQQSAGQGVIDSAGHVAVVEKVNKDGTVYTSDYNWSKGPGQLQYVTFHPGAGVQFIWADDNAKGNGFLLFAINPSTILDNANALGNPLSANASVTQFLAECDNFLVIKNPFDVDTSGIQDSVAGFSFTDPIKWLQAFAGNVFSDVSAIIIRIILLALGGFILFKILDHYINISGAISGATEKASSLASQLGPLLA